ncbi:MAG: hypothetical protein M0Z69_00590 [Actinomycetota bacterium]|nr:hypothetical protein [Actinomycetota bacterium]
MLADPKVSTADGEKDQLLGNLTIGWSPDEQWVETNLPQPLAHLANRPHGRLETIRRGSAASGFWSFFVTVAWQLRTCLSATFAQRGR